jgi:hypothetical protein
MIEKTKKTTIKINVVLSLILIIIGLTIHSIKPTEIGNSNVSSEPNNGIRMIENIESNYTVQIKPLLEQDGQELKIHIFISFISQTNEINFSLYVLNEINYNEFLNGSNLEELDLIREYHDIAINVGEIKEVIGVHETRDIFFVVVNQGVELFDIAFFYYYSITPITYFIGLVILAIGVAIALSNLAWYFVGWKRYFIIGASINIGVFLFGIANFPNYRINPDILNEILHLELYQDFKFFYMEWISEFKNGFWPYSQPYFNYIYGPLFILTIGGASYLPFPPWSGAIPIFLSTLGTGVLIFLIVYKITSNEKKSIISMIVYFLNPFTIFYSSYLWLNPTIFVFFILLSFYLLLNDKRNFAMVSLGIATMLKQFTIVFFPLFLILLVKQVQIQKENRQTLFDQIKGLIKYASIYIIVILLISTPFLIVDFNTYYYSYFQMHTNYSVDYVNTLTYYLGYPVRFNDFFLFVGAPNFFTLPIAYLLTYFIPLGVCLLIIFIKYLKFKVDVQVDCDLIKLKQDLVVKAIFLSIFLVISLHIFFPRGSYKFYLILLTPFISIFFDARNLNLLKISSKNAQKVYKRYYIPILVCWVIFFMYRYVYFWLLIFLSFYYILQRRRIID